MPCGECTSTTGRQAGGNTGRLFLTFGGPVCADRLSYCPLDRVLTHKNLIYLLNLQICHSYNVQLKEVEVKIEGLDEEWKKLENWRLQLEKQRKRQIHYQKVCQKLY